MLDQLARAAPDARVRLAHAGAEIGFHRGRIVVHAPARRAVRRRRGAAKPRSRCRTARSNSRRARAPAIAARGAGRRRVTVRPAPGGERIRLAADRPRRALKGLLQDAGMPPWQRESLPLVFCGDALAAVPGIGVDVAFQAAAGHAGRVRGTRVANVDGINGDPPDG